MSSDTDNGHERRRNEYENGVTELPSARGGEAKERQTVNEKRETDLTRVVFEEKWAQRSLHTGQPIIRSFVPFRSPGSLIWNRFFIDYYCGALFFLQDRWTCLMFLSLLVPCLRCTHLDGPFLFHRCAQPASTMTTLLSSRSLSHSLSRAWVIRIVVRFNYYFFISFANSAR